LELEHYISDDGNFHLALQGNSHGALHFKDFMAFVAFIEMCCDVAEEYNNYIKDYAESLTPETPIPGPFLSAL
jgi:hypothetical protein